MKIKWFNTCKVPRGKLARCLCFVNVHYEGYLCYYYWISVDLIFQNNAYFKGFVPRSPLSFPCHTAHSDFWQGIDGHSHLVG